MWDKCFTQLQSRAHIHLTCGVFCFKVWTFGAFDGYFTTSAKSTCVEQSNNWLTRIYAAKEPAIMFVNICLNMKVLHISEPTLIKIDFASFNTTNHCIPKFKCFIYVSFGYQLIDLNLLRKKTKIGI